MIFTFGVANVSATGSNFLRLSDQPVSGATTLSTHSGSLLAAAGLSDIFIRDGDASGIGGLHPPVAPDNTAPTNAWRTEKRYTGKFNAGHWQVIHGMIIDAVDGWFDTSIYRGFSPTAVGAVLVQSGGVDAGIDVPEFLLNDEYLFISVSWHAQNDSGSSQVFSHTLVEGAGVVTTEFSVPIVVPQYGPQQFGNPNPITRFRSPVAYPQSVAGNIFTQDLSGILAPGPGSLLKQPQKILSGASPTSGVLTKQSQRSLTASLATSGSIVKQTQKLLAGTLSFASGIVSGIKIALKSLTGTLTTSGTLVKQTSKLLSGTLNESGSLIKQTQKILSGALTSSGSLVKTTFKVLTAVLASSGVLSTSKVALKALVGTLSFVGTIVKQPQKSLVASIATSGSILKVVQKSLAGTLTSTGLVVRRIPKNLSGTVSFIGTTSGFKTIIGLIVKAIITGKKLGLSLFGIKSGFTLIGKNGPYNLLGKQSNPTLTGKQSLVALMANKVNLPDLPLGDDFIIALVLTNPDGTPFDLSGGGTVSFAMKLHSFDTTFVLQKDSATGGISITNALGKANLIINAADTVGISPGPYDYSVKAVSGSGKKNTQLVGQMIWIDHPSRTV